MGYHPIILGVKPIFKGILRVQLDTSFEEKIVEVPQSEVAENPASWSRLGRWSGKSDGGVSRGWRAAQT